MIDFGCLTSIAMNNKKPVNLFSEYESVTLGKLTFLLHFKCKILRFYVLLGPATELDDFENIFIEPTIDAVTKMTIFIGNKKYKEDFI